MATVEQLTIEFSGKGAPKLTAQLNSLSKAMNRLAARQIEANKNTEDGAKANKEYGESFRKFSRNAEKGDDILSKFGRTMSKMRSRMLIVAFAFGVVSKAIGALVKQYNKFIGLQGKINAILSSTGMAAGKSALQLENMANSYQQSFAVANTVIMEMQARLLTFTNIVGSQFEKASLAALDLSAVFGQDLNQATIQIGKAINDPVKGYTALRRIGVSFSATQVKMIKQFQEQGDIISAQNVIFKELNREFGGAAKAALRGTYGSNQWTKALNNLGDAGRHTGELLQPTLAAIGGILNGLAIIAEKTLGFFPKIGERIGLVAKHWTNFSDMIFNDKTWVLTREAIDNIEDSVVNTEFTMKKLMTNIRQEFVDTGESLKSFTKQEDLDIMTKKALQFAKASNFEESTAWVNKYVEAQKNNETIMNNQLIAQEKLDESANEYIKTLDKQLHTLQLSASLEKLTTKDILGREKATGKQIRKLKKLTTLQKLELKFGNELNKLSKEDRDLLEERAVEIDGYYDSLESGKKLEKEMAEAVKLRNKFIKDQVQALKELFDSNIEQERALADARIEIIDEAEERELDRIRNTWAYKRATDISKQRMEEAVTKQFKTQKEEETKAANEEIKKQFKNKQLLQKGEAVMATAKGVAEAGNPSFWWMIPMIIANGLAQVATINAQQPPTMRYGGVVGGNRHEQGGTMIEAERGEFVMRREAVARLGIENMEKINNLTTDISETSREGWRFGFAGKGLIDNIRAGVDQGRYRNGGLVGDTVGIETSNRINQGGEQASVNISFSGNVLSEEFITEEAIPKIKQAIRRGADIGIG